jgi:hypothetical protein
MRSSGGPQRPTRQSVPRGLSPTIPEPATGAGSPPRSLDSDGSPCSAEPEIGSSAGLRAAPRGSDPAVEHARGRDLRAHGGVGAGSAKETTRSTGTRSPRSTSRREVGPVPLSHRIAKSRCPRGPGPRASRDSPGSRFGSSVTVSPSPTPASASSRRSGCRTSRRALHRLGAVQVSGEVTLNRNREVGDGRGDGSDRRHRRRRRRWATRTNKRAPSGREDDGREGRRSCEMGFTWLLRRERSTGRQACPDLPGDPLP